MKKLCLHKARCDMIPGFLYPIQFKSLAFPTINHPWHP